MSKRLAGALAALTMACAVSAPVQAQQAATIEARSASGGVIVTWRLVEPTTRAAFLASSVIRDTWTVTTPGLTLKDGVVESEAPFQTFDIRITPDVAEVDRIYMGLSKAGEGHVLYGPGLELQGMDAELTARLVAGEVAVPTSEAVKGYLYLGPQEALMRRDGAAVVTSASAPPALTELLRDGFFAAQKFYGARLGHVLTNEPTLIISTDSPGPTGFRGDVTDTGLISLRFHGEMWASPPPDVAVPLGTFVWHEVLHLWNGNGMKMKDSGAAPWLHEGMAEYGALVAAASTGVIDEGQARGALAKRLNGCREALGDADYDARKLAAGSAIYNCGVVVQWIADLEARRASGGAGDVFDLWRTMLDAGRVGDGYGVADFRDLMQPDSAVAVLMDGPGAARWSGIEARLAALGVTLENGPDADQYRVAALFHLNGENCAEGSNGFYMTEQGVKLDTGDKCGVLSGDPLLVAVEDLDPASEASAMFFAVQARCAASQPVRYRTQDAKLIEAKCATPLDAPKAWAVTAAPPLATRATRAT